MSIAGLPAWVRMWNELGAVGADEGLYNRLVACWNEEHRRYHTLQHLRECLAWFNKVRGLAGRAAEVELALWFHDAFYDPRRTDNEARSADWARASVLQAGLRAEVAGRVHELVMATRHQAIPHDADSRLLVDVDLSILGAEPGRFDEFDEQVRAEYAHVPDAAFREGRSRILDGFLARPRLYGTDPLFQALEERARSNLRRALARLHR
jgi:predicted metal-dependent HD superfamily phosphohydrolase